MRKSRVVVLLLGILLAGCGGAAAPAASSAPASSPAGSAAPAKPSAATGGSASPSAPAASASANAAGNFPARTVTIIVPQTPGSVFDTYSRALAPVLQSILGQSVNVEDRPGASSVIGTQYVAKQAQADGYTVLAMGPHILNLMPVTVKDLPFDVKDVQPLAEVGETTNVWASPPDASWSDWKSFVDYGKANPGKLTYGAGSTVTQMNIAYGLQQLKIDAVYVPFSDNASNLAALLGGKIQAAQFTDGQAKAQGNKIKVLASTSSKRSPAFPNVPSYGELNLVHPLPSVFGYYIRTGTPQPVLDKLYAAFTKALQDPAVTAAIQKQDIAIPEKAPTIDELKKLDAENSTRAVEIAKALNIKAQ